jgi:flavin-dependent dehydrogenase
MDSLESKTYDAIILGGGPGGATAGLLLAKWGWRVAIVEKRNFPRPKLCGDFISAPAVALLLELGLGAEFLELAGPEVRRVGIFEADSISTAPMPQGTDALWGRALSRKQLDNLILTSAARAGAELWQPWTALRLEKRGDRWHCHIGNPGRTRELFAPVIIVATGSLEPGPLRFDCRNEHDESDFLAFKAYFRECDLPNDLMPLLVFPGGYGGLVHCRQGRVSLSCCIRRRTLHRIRQPQRRAADAVLQHICTTCAGARSTLARARLDGTWLAAGPIRPGIRHAYSGGLFFVGNVAGEAHPIIAEGISMAVQSAWLLSRSLVAGGSRTLIGRVQDEIGQDYSARWAAAFAQRIRASFAFAAFSIHPGVTALARPIIKSFPGLLTCGAYLAGKSRGCQ